jgi:hypothetical protein
VIPLRDEPGGADPTGVWFDEPTAEGLREALLRFEKNSDRFLPGIARLNAKRFSRHHFRSEFSSVVEELLASRRSGTSSAPARAVGAS